MTIGYALYVIAVFVIAAVVVAPLAKRTTKPVDTLTIWIGWIMLVVFASVYFSEALA